MTDTTDTENKLAAMQEIYDEVCRDADADGVREESELELIARVGAKLEALKEKLRDENRGGGGDDDAPKKAWTDLSDTYKDLLKLHAALKSDGSSHATDLNVFLQAISGHLAAEDWQSAVNELALATIWIDENELWEYGEEEEDDTDYEKKDQKSKDDASGKTGWIKLEGPEMLAEFKEKLKELEDQESAHAKTVAQYCKSVDDAVAAEDWKTATTSLLFMIKYFGDNGLDGDEDQDEGWLERVADFNELSDLVSGLISGGVAGASEIAGALADIMAAVAKGEYENAGILLDEALTRAREMAAGAEEEEKEIEGAKDAWTELASTYKDMLQLHAQLEKDEDEFANDLNVHLQAITAHLAADDWASAVNELLLASIFATDNELWDNIEEDEDTDKEEEDASGKTVWDLMEGDTQLDKIKDVLKNLKERSNPHADHVDSAYNAIKDAADEEDWKRATSKMLLLDKFMIKNDLYTAGEDESWLDKAADLAELSTLAGDLVAAGVEGATEIADAVTQIMAEAASGNFTTALDLLDQTLARAREMAEAAGGGAGGEEVPTIDPASASITGPVGKKGQNRPADVETIQLLLNQNGASLTVDSDCGSLTIGAIETFQQGKFGWKDGKVDPSGKTFGALTGQATGGEILDNIKDAASDAAKAITDTASDVVETVTDAVENVTDFFEDLFDGDDEDAPKEKET
ncbi:MAG: hypothetical protein AB8B60_13910 [Sulfitobacter sp.]